MTMNNLRPKCDACKSQNLVGDIVGVRCADCGRVSSIADVGMIAQMADEAAKAAYESIDHPQHYGGADDPYEAIKIIEALGWLEGFCKGSALKYLVRAGDKPGESEDRDLGKAEWYIRYWRERRAAATTKGEKSGQQTEQR